MHRYKTNTSGKLGAVRNNIVVETFVSLLLNIGHLVLQQVPAWKTKIGKKVVFYVADLIKYALITQVNLADSQERN